MVTTPPRMTGGGVFCVWGSGDLPETGCHLFPAATLKTAGLGGSTKGCTGEIDFSQVSRKVRDWPEEAPLKPADECPTTLALRPPQASDPLGGRVSVLEDVWTGYRPTTQRTKEPQFVAELEITLSRDRLDVLSVERRHPHREERPEAV